MHNSTLDTLLFGMTASDWQTSLQTTSLIFWWTLAIATKQALEAVSPMFAPSASRLP